jgi:hypothetical protein
MRADHAVRCEKQSTEPVEGIADGGSNTDPRKFGLALFPRHTPFETTNAKSLSRALTA